MKAPFKKGDLVIGICDGFGSQWHPFEPQTVYRLYKNKVFFSRDIDDWVYWNGAINGEPKELYIRKV